MSNQEYPWYQLKYGIAEFMIPKLEDYKSKFIESGQSIPSWVADEISENYSDEQIEELNLKWVAELDEMILSFKMVLNYNTGDEPSIDYDETKIQKGIALFAKYYQDLWD